MHSLIESQALSVDSIAEYSTKTQRLALGVVVGDSFGTCRFPRPLNLRASVCLLASKFELSPGPLGQRTTQPSRSGCSPQCYVQARGLTAPATAELSRASDWVDSTSLPSHKDDTGSLTVHEDYDSPMMDQEMGGTEDVTNAAGPRGSSNNDHGESEQPSRSAQNRAVI